MWWAGQLFNKFAFMLNSKSVNYRTGFLGEKCNGCVKLCLSMKSCPRWAMKSNQKSRQTKCFLAINMYAIWQFDELKVCGAWLLEFDFFLGKCISSGVYLRFKVKIGHSNWHWPLIKKDLNFLAFLFTKLKGAPF